MTKSHPMHVSVPIRNGIALNSFIRIGFDFSTEIKDNLNESHPESAFSIHSASEMNKKRTTSKEREEDS